MWWSGISSGSGRSINFQAALHEGDEIVIDLTFGAGCKFLEHRNNQPLYSVSGDKLHKQGFDKSDHGYSPFVKWTFLTRGCLHIYEAATFLALHKRGP